MTDIGTVLLMIFILFENVVHSDNTVLKTRHGKMRGSILMSQNGKSFFAFRGIPYAKPPVKELRFEPPVPMSRWKGVLDATKDGQACIQYDDVNLKLKGDEDCLYLNVYSSQLTIVDPKPVMVWIFAGGFIFGDGSSTVYGPEKLMDKDIVLVTFNYRVSTMGFLSTGDSVSPGNYGLLDQVQALKWVQENIDTFGGDPNSVTIFGESAGGASVIYHIISPLSKGLFHAAIAQSGTAISSWAIMDDSIQFARHLAMSLGCPIDSSRKLFCCLKMRAASDIALNKNTSTKFMPTVDKDWRSSPFLPDYPSDLIKNNQVNHVPIVMGTTKDEGYFFLISLVQMSGGLSRFLEAPVDRILEFLEKGNTRYETTTGKLYLKKLILKYFADLKNDSSVEEKILTTSNFLGDFFVNIDTDVTIEDLVVHGVPTYAYRLTRRASSSYTSLLSALINPDLFDYGEKFNIVSHTDELSYLFKSNEFIDDNFDVNDKIIEDFFLTLWTNFAKNKVPSFDGSKTKVNCEWIRRQSGKPLYLDVNLRPQMSNNYFAFRQSVFKSQYVKTEL